MIGSLTKALKKVFGDKHQRDLKEVMPLVEEIKAAHASLTGTSNDELRARSAALKARIAQGTKSNDDRVAQLRSEIEAEPNMDIHEREERYQEIDKLEAESVQRIEEVRRIEEADDAVEAGERIGLIRYGSQVNLYVPLDVEITVKDGDKVSAGQTIVGRWKNAGSAQRAGNAGRTVEPAGVGA